MTTERKKILMMDDDLEWAGVLERTGRYEVLGEADPTRAAAVAANFKPDLILMDLWMPAMDGVTLARQLHSDPKFSNTPIVFLTAHIDKDQTRVQGFPAVAKPVTLVELVGAIEANLAAGVIAPS